MPPSYLPLKGLSDAHIFPSLSNGLCPKSQNSISCVRSLLAHRDLNRACKYLIGESFLRSVRCVNRIAHKGEGSRPRMWYVYASPLTERGLAPRRRLLLLTQCRR